MQGSCRICRIVMMKLFSSCSTLCYGSWIRAWSLIHAQEIQVIIHSNYLYLFATMEEEIVGVSVRLNQLFLFLQTRLDHPS